MELQELTDLATDPDKLAETLKSYPRLFKAEDYKLYQPENHRVFDEQLRKKKKVDVPTGKMDGKNQPITETTYAEVVRVGLPLQKLIVQRASSFAAGQPVQLQADPQTEQEKLLFQMVKKIWQDNKLDYQNIPLVETMMSEREVAEVWYFDNAPDDYWGTLLPGKHQRLRMITLKPSEGNQFYPLFNGLRDMVGFVRMFEVEDVEKAEKIPCLDIHTENQVLQFHDQGQGYIPRPGETLNKFGKIPVIYYAQPRTEWQDVQPAIERLEELLSNHGDINDYNGSPAIVAEGKILGFSAKGERGKAFEVEKGGSLKYLSWDHAPESIKLEIENLFNIIYSMTQTPNISFQEVKGLSAMSGVAIKLLFMDAHSKARRKQASGFGESIQRRINLLKAGVVKLNPTLQEAQQLVITPIFQDYMPTNELEAAQVETLQVSNLMRANGNRPILTLDEAVRLSPLPVEDPKAETTKLLHQEKELQLTQNLP